MMINETVHFLQWEHLALTLYSLHWDMGTRVEAWPGLCLGNSVPASEHQCSDVWALGLGGLLWKPCPPQWASLALPGVSAAVGLLVCPLPGSPSWGSWRPLRWATW